VDFLLIFLLGGGGARLWCLCAFVMAVSLASHVGGLVSLDARSSLGCNGVCKQAEQKWHSSVVVAGAPAFQSRFFFGDNSPYASTSVVWRGAMSAGGSKAVRALGGRGGVVAAAGGEGSTATMASAPELVKPKPKAKPQELVRHSATFALLRNLVL
jgi:hypothetical protein